MTNFTRYQKKSISRNIKKNLKTIKEIQNNIKGVTCFIVGSDELMFILNKNYIVPPATISTNYSKF
jgi:hypothetical protein